MIGRKSVSSSPSSSSSSLKPSRSGVVLGLQLLLGDRRRPRPRTVPWRCRARHRSGTRRRPRGPSSSSWSHSFLALMLPGLVLARAGPGTSRSRPAAASCRAVRRVGARRLGEVLPAVEVGVGLQVGLPGVLDRRLEGHHQHLLGAELLGELVGGEGLAEAHLGVPQEARHRVRVLVPDRVEVGVRLVDGLGLLRPHRERLVVGAGELQPGAQLGDRRPARRPACSASTPRVRRVLRSPCRSGARAHRGRENTDPSSRSAELVEVERVVLDQRGLAAAAPTRDLTRPAWSARP